MQRPKHPVAFFSLVFVMILLLGGVYFFVYFSLLYFLDWYDGKNTILAIIFLFLWLSFPFASMLAGKWDNRRTRYFYYLAAVGLGVLQFATISFLGGWIAYYMTGIFGYEMPHLLVLALSIATTIGVSVYGLYNARIIRTKRITVEIKNLPEYWQNKKIALISDVHVGHILRKNFLKRIVKRVNREDLEMLCIAGDLFDGMDGRLEHLFDPFKEIQTKHGIFYADGNHETYLGVERAFRALAPLPVNILRDEIVRVEGLDIIGIDYPEVGESKNIAQTILSLPDYNRENPSILLFHTPFQIDEIAKTGVDLELCGHTHKWQMWPFGLITKLVFHGMDYGISKIGNFTLYTSSGIGTWGPPMRVGSISEFVVITLVKK